MQLKQARGIGTIVLERLVAELQGVAASAVEVIEPQRKGMAVTRSFGTLVLDLETLNDLTADDLRPRTLFEGDVDRRARLMTALDEDQRAVRQVHRGAGGAGLRARVEDASRELLASVDDAVVAEFLPPGNHNARSLNFFDKGGCFWGDQHVDSGKRRRHRPFSRTGSCRSRRL